jgi:hypothetical protein
MRARRQLPKRSTPQNLRQGLLQPKPAAERDLSMATYAKDCLSGRRGRRRGFARSRTQERIGWRAEVAASSGTPRLDKYAQDTVKEWRYVPATVNGAPVDTWISCESVLGAGDAAFRSNAFAELSPATIRRHPSEHLKQERLPFASSSVATAKSLKRSWISRAVIPALTMLHSHCEDRSEIHACHA